MTKQNKSRKLFAVSASAALVASAIVPVASASAGFNDATSISEWAVDSVNYATDNGIIGGKPGNVFDPKGTVLRGEAAKMLALGAGLEIDEEATTDFSDVQADAWFTPYIAAAVEAKIIQGKGEGKFAPNDKLTRAEAAVLFTKAYPELEAGDEDLAGFKDTAGLAKWKTDALKVAVNNGIIKGKGNGDLLAADQEISREEFAVILYRALEVTDNLVSTELEEALEALEQAVEAVKAFEEVTAENAEEVQEALDALYGAIEAVEELDAENEALEAAKELAEATEEALATSAEDIKAAVDAAKEETAKLPAAGSVNKENTAAAQAAVNAAQAAVDAANSALARANEEVTEEEAKAFEAAIKAEQAKIDAVKEAIVEANKPVVGLAVESVSAINAAQVKIVFNQKVDEDTAENLDNYYIGLTKNVSSKFVADLANTGYTATLLEDEKTVIISADNAATHAIWVDEYTGTTAVKTSATETILENRTVYVQIKDVKTADGKLASTIETSFVAKDSEGPKFAKDSYSVSTSTTNPTITFNEPVVISGLGANNDDAKFYLNGVDVTAAVDYKLSSTNVGTTPLTVKEFSELTLDLATIAAGFELNEGNNTFEVVGIQDLAGNATSSSRIVTTIKVAEETAVAPKLVDVVQVHDGAFVVLFDKEIADETGTVTIKNNINDGTDWKVLLNATAVGTSGADGFAAPTPVFDGTKTNINPNGYYGYVVEFDQDGNYGTDEVYQGANSVIRTIEVKDFQDTTKTKTGTKFTKAYTFKKDNIAPTVATAKVIDDAPTGSGDQDIQLTFTDAPFNGLTTIGTGSDDIILKVVENGITTTVAVPFASVTQDAATANVYTLALDASNTTPMSALYAAEADLFDNNGKLKAGISVTLPYGLVADTNAADTPQYQDGYQFIGSTIAVQGGSSAVVPQTSQADVTYNAALNAIDVVFHGEDIDAATVTNKANYTFDGKKVSDIAGATIEYSVTTGTKLARIFLPENSVVRNGNYNLKIENIATKSGAKMLPTTVVAYNVEDNTLPVFTAAKVTSDNTIEVTFDETVVPNLTSLARNFTVVAGGNYSVGTVTVKNGTTLVLTTVDKFSYAGTVQVKFQADASNDIFLTDVAGNKAKSGVTVTATKDIQ